MTDKTLQALHPALRDDIGDLITRRPVPGPRVDQVDPFLFLNHHGPQTYAPNNLGLPFGPHPHRGFETVTFILEGDLAHHDTAGHESIIKAGGVQWMTAGSGLVHAEVSPDDFKRQGGPLELLQLWVNLPGRLKMSPPRYIGLQGDEIPAWSTPDGLATIHLTSGTWEGHAGPISSLTGVSLATVDLKPAGRVGTINEFTVAFEDGKPIGVLEGEWETDEVIRNIMDKGHRTRENIIFDKDPKNLIKRLLEILAKRKITEYHVYKNPGAQMVL